MSASPYDTGIKWDRFFCSPGESCDRTVEFRVRSIYIDNLSDSWLYLPDLARYIPPLTLGWQANFNGPTNRIRVQASAAPPSGIQSSNTGGNVTIDVYSINKGESFGTTLGSVSNQAQAQQILASLMIFNPPVVNGVHIAGVTNKRIVILSWNISWTFFGLPIAPTGRYPIFLNDTTGSFKQTVLQDGSLSDDFDMYPYGLSLKVGDALNLNALTDDGSSPDFASRVRYYFADA